MEILGGSELIFKIYYGIPFSEGGMGGLGVERMAFFGPMTSVKEQV